MKLKFKELSEYCDIPVPTLKSQKKAQPKQFKAFEIGAFCIVSNITMEDLVMLDTFKKQLKEEVKL